jgi:hypothetical protein
MRNISELQRSAKALQPIVLAGKRPFLIMCVSLLGLPSKTSQGAGNAFDLQFKRALSKGFHIRNPPLPNAQRHRALGGDRDRRIGRLYCFPSYFRI